MTSVDGARTVPYAGTGGGTLGAGTMLTCPPAVGTRAAATSLDGCGLGVTVAVGTPAPVVPTATGADTAGVGNETDTGGGADEHPVRTKTIPTIANVIASTVLPLLLMSTQQLSAWVAATLSAGQAKVFIGWPRAV